MTSKNVKSISRKVALLTVSLTVSLTFVTGPSAPTLSITAQNRVYSSVTGYFGLDDDGVPSVDRHGIMLVFDGAIAPETVSNTTFEVFHNENHRAEVIDTRVDGAFVFIRLSEELPSDATPILMIAQGEEVEDLAGNSTNRRKFGEIRIKDGIAPKLTVALSGGSGRGTGDEGPDRLTNNSIKIHLTSDEPLQGAPRIIVTCKEIMWIETSESGEIERDIDDFIENRNGPLPLNPSEPPETMFTCGYDADGDGNSDPIVLTEHIARSQQGQSWEYIWQRIESGPAMLQDGELVVVAFARDRSRYERDGETVSNWATATAEFGLDTLFNLNPTSKSPRVHPPDGSVVREERPFVLIQFPEASTVTLISVIFDGVEIADQFDIVRHNEYVYWPLSMNQGEHEVEVVAMDAAGNPLSIDFGFTSTRRGDFVLDLVPGWNAISLPSNPAEPSIASVFSEPGIKAVIAWDETAPENPWAISIRKDDTWESPSESRAITQIREGIGYWVKSVQFTKQPMALRPAPDKSRLRSLGGWNFLGVVDRGGNQTQNHNRETLKNENGNQVTAGTYLGEYTLAFTWDTLTMSFKPLTPDETMTIGDGIWVYYD